MIVEMEAFITQNSKLNLEFHPSDKKALVVRNCSFENGAKLCEKYGASGHSVGKNEEHFAITNFGQYK